MPIEDTRTFIGTMVPNLMGQAGRLVSGDARLSYLVATGYQIAF